MSQTASHFAQQLSFCQTNQNKQQQNLFTLNTTRVLDSLVKEMNDTEALIIREKSDTELSLIQEVDLQVKMSASMKTQNCEHSL